jgi:secondary thiamine-phosphate synthase enzyme
MKIVQISSSQQTQFLEISNQVQACVEESDFRNGAVLVFVPHTTAGVTVNEHADPHVVHDMIMVLDDLIPWTRRSYRHEEGNSAAHVKASLMGSSVTVPVKDGKLALGTWQGIFVCEFDGPRTRDVYLQLLPDA